MLGQIRCRVRHTVGPGAAGDDDRDVVNEAARVEVVEVGEDAIDDRLCLAAVEALEQVDEAGLPVEGTIVVSGFDEAVGVDDQLPPGTTAIDPVCHVVTNGPTIGPVGPNRSSEAPVARIACG